MGLCVQGYLAHKKRHPVGPCSMTMSRLLWRSWGGGCFLKSEVPLYRADWVVPPPKVWARSGTERCYEDLGQLGQDEPASG